MSVPVVFCGVGDDLAGITHYRSLVPARTIGAAAIVQDSRGEVWHSEGPDVLEPEVIVMQMPVYRWQFNQILKAQSQGIKVFVSVDDYIPSLTRQYERGAHAHGHVFNKKLRDLHLMCLNVADGILCSTEWLAWKYSSRNETRLFKNGLDLERYDVEPVEKDVPVLGWSGGTGHVRALGSITPVILDVMRRHKDLCFVAQGDGEAYQRIASSDGMLARCAHFKWSDLWQYPRDLACFSVGLAPSEENDFFRSKSQLRFYESAALGVPLVAGPLYSEIEHGVDGFIAKDHHDWTIYLDLLLDEPELADRMGRKAQERARSSFGAVHRCKEWCDALGVEQSAEVVAV